MYGKKDYIRLIILLISYEKPDAARGTSPLNTQKLSIFLEHNPSIRRKIKRGERSFFELPEPNESNVRRTKIERFIDRETYKGK